MAKKQQIIVRTTASQKAELKLKAKESDSTLSKFLMANLEQEADVIRLVNTLEDISLKLNGVNGKLSKSGTLKQAQVLANSILKTIEKMDIKPVEETILSTIQRVKANQNK